MKLTIDANICQGHGLCYSLAPEFFDCDDSGYASVRNPEVDKTEEASVRRAVNACPELAIRLSSADS